MSKCICCSNQLVRHIRHSRVYWFCSHCWQEMPDLAEVIAASQTYLPRLERLMEQPALTSR